jgi:hypothetical protein
MEYLAMRRMVGVVARLWGAAPFLNLVVGKDVV